MNTRRTVVGLLVAVGLASAASVATAQSDVVLVHQRTEDLFSICQIRYDTGPELVASVPYWVGNNPMGIAFDGTSLYISGFFNSFSASSTGAGSRLPMARLFDGTATDFGGGIINPITGRVIVGGEALTEVVPVGDPTYPAGLFYTHGITKITLNANGSSTYASNKFMKTNFQDNSFITAANPTGLMSMGYPNSWGTSLDYAPGAGLLATFETGSGSNTPSKVRWYDTTPTGAPTLMTPNRDNQVSGTNKIIGGAAWDFGADGTGFDYKGPSGYFPDGIKDGPLAAVMVAPTSPSPTQYGPIGIDRERLNPHFNNGQLAAGTASVIYHAGYPGDIFPALPALNFGPRITAQPSSILWSDIAVHPITGTMIARASNDLIYSYRNANGSADPARTGRLLSDNDLAFSIGQKCSIIYGVPGLPDLAVWNNRDTDNGLPLTTLFKFAKLDGVVPPAPATATVVKDTTNPLTGEVTRAPFSVTILGTIADVHYHAPSRTLVVLDFSDYYAYVFKVEATTPPAPACLADVNSDGVIDGSDFVAFINSFGVGSVSIDPTADVNRDLIIDGNDFVEFINAFGAGC